MSQNDPPNGPAKERDLLTKLKALSSPLGRLYSIHIVMGIIVLLIAALFNFQGLHWDEIWHLHPDEPQSLQLSADERLLYEKAAVWSSSEVSEKSWGSRFPVLAWFIVLEVIGLLALPLTWMTFKNLSDRGHIFSKVLGLLVISWGTWMIASTRLAAFTWWTILAVVAFLALVTSLLISNEKWNDLKNFVQERWRLLLFE